MVCSPVLRRMSFWLVTTWNQMKLSDSRWRSTCYYPLLRGKNIWVSRSLKVKMATYNLSAWFAMISQFELLCEEKFQHIRNSWATKKIQKCSEREGEKIEWERLRESVSVRVWVGESEGLRETERECVSERECEFELRERVRYWERERNSKRLRES